MTATLTAAPQVVVITGASAGIGRATARQFGAHGARVGLLARGQAGLDAAANEVEKAGGQALAIATDVADYDQVDKAAARVEEAFGPIDVWVNVAFTSVFAPFHQISAAEFRRVTEVSYLGFVHGTMVALDRMRPRNRGAIVQVGSALGARAIPLQSAYCGAKHAINGFTESVRTELMHEHSNIHITVAQMPAVNTPQFSWVLSRLPRHPQPVPPIYQPISPPARSSSPPNTPPANSTGSAPAPPPPSSDRNSPPQYWTATSPAPATPPNKPGKASTRTARTTSTNHSTVTPAPITARTVYSIRNLASEHRNCGFPTTPASPPPPPRRPARRAWPVPQRGYGARSVGPDSSSPRCFRAELTPSWSSQVARLAPRSPEKHALLPPKPGVGTTTLNWPGEPPCPDPARIPPGSPRC